MFDVFANSNLGAGSLQVFRDHNTTLAGDHVDLNNNNSSDSSAVAASPAASQTLKAIPLNTTPVANFGNATTPKSCFKTPKSALRSASAKKKNAKMNSASAKKSTAKKSQNNNNNNNNALKTPTSQDSEVPPTAEVQKTPEQLIGCATRVDFDAWLEKLRRATASASKVEMRKLWDGNQETEQLRALLEKVKTAELEIANAEAEEGAWQATQLEALCEENQGLAEELDKAEGALEEARAIAEQAEQELKDERMRAESLEKCVASSQERIDKLSARIDASESHNEELQSELRVAKDDHRAAAESARAQGKLIEEMSGELNEARQCVSIAEQKVTLLEEQAAIASAAAAAEAEALSARLRDAEEATIEMETRAARAEELLAAAEEARAEAAQAAEKARRHAQETLKERATSESVAALAVHHAVEENRRKTNSLQASLEQAKDGLRARDAELACARDELENTKASLKATEDKLNATEEAARDLSEVVATARELETRAFDKADAARVAFDEANMRAAELAGELQTSRVDANALAASEEAREEAERAAAATAAALAEAQSELAELRASFASAADELREARAEAARAQQTSSSAAPATIPVTPAHASTSGRKSLGGVSKRIGSSGKKSSLQAWVESAVHLTSAGKKTRKVARTPASPLTDSDSDATPPSQRRRKRKSGGAKLGWSPVAGMILPGVSSLRAASGVGSFARRAGFGVGVARRAGRVRSAYDAEDAEVARRARAAGVSVTALLGNRARRMAGVGK